LFLPVQTKVAKIRVHDKVAGILAGELDFHTQSSAYASHRLHAFAAKFPPQLPQVFIQQLTNPGDVVLDPMVGSGTTVVEAFLLGRKGIGIDIDPLARLICRVKTSRLQTEKASVAGGEVLSRALSVDMDKERVRRLFDEFDTDSRKFLDYWFLRETQQQIASLLIAINERTDVRIKEFLLLVLSSVIITKSGGVSLARDLAHSRPHRDMSKVPRNAYDQFRKALLKIIPALHQLPAHRNGIQIKDGDARDLPLANNSVDLIVTSPPYANALDYMRAHKFSLVWLGHSISDLGEHRSKYIGSERIGTLSDQLPDFTLTVLGKLAALDAKKERIVRKYFSEMKQVFQEMLRVMKTDTASIIVVGPSTMRGYVIPTQECLADIGRSIGFDVVGINARKLDRNRRMMPARFKTNQDSMIEQRMHEEFVIAFVKP
jgi:DNA modification methylase